MSYRLRALYPLLALALTACAHNPAPEERARVSEPVVDVAPPPPAAPAVRKAAPHKGAIQRAAERKKRPGMVAPLAQPAQETAPDPAPPQPPVTQPAQRSDEDEDIHTPPPAKPVVIIEVKKPPSADAPAPPPPWWKRCSGLAGWKAFKDC